jgi:2-dehydro-3-deoxyphosphogluconate aldolase / (4S)-4-hydroxy-2-oxoglutarate aldolase
VNQQTAVNFILAGAAVLGIGGELLPKDSLHLKEEERIHELARRFAGMVKDARHRKSRARHDG